MLRREKSIKTALFTFVLLLAGVAVAQTPGQVPQGANIPRNMKPYFLCLLEKGEKWTPVQFADPAMQEHLAYIREEVGAGKAGGTEFGAQRVQRTQRRNSSALFVSKIKKPSAPRICRSRGFTAGSSENLEPEFRVKNECRVQGRCADCYACRG